MSKEKKQIWGGHLEQSPDELMVRFCAGRDVAPLPMADSELFPFDLWTNRAHAIMLHKQGALDAAQLRSLLWALTSLERDWEKGRFKLDPELEDIHANVERYVTEKAGVDIGGRLHTGRSRNDQVACDMRLFMRGGLLELGQALAGLTETLLIQAVEHSATLIPGFSHHQPAMVTTWGHWLCSYIQALCRDLERVRLAFDMVNRSPLGAAAGFGTSWPIDRELTAELLAFARVDINSLDCISSRWEHEAQVVQTIALVMSHLSLMAQDLIMLSHPYWDFVKLADSYVTGSSIMPQKRNPDFAEVVKGKTAWVNGVLAGLMGTPHGGMSGYNRDSQQTKYAILDVFRECQPAPLVMDGAFQSLQVNHKSIEPRLQEGYLLAADFADGLANKLKLPFRTCYDIAAEAVRLSGESGKITSEAATQALQAAQPDQAAGAAGELLSGLEDPALVISWRNHTGAPSPRSVRRHLETIQWELAVLTPFISTNKEQIERASKRCRDYADKELN